MGMPYRVCFVCLGNICRSPMSAAVMTSMVSEAGLDGEIVVSSAGTGDWHIGAPADKRARAALIRGGYDGSDHRARQITAGWFDDLDLVLAHDASNLKALRQLENSRNLETTGHREIPRQLAGTEYQSKVQLLREFDPQASGDLNVPDPYFGERYDFDDVLAMVERSCRGLLDHLQAEHRSRPW